MAVLTAAAVLSLASSYGDWDANWVVWQVFDAGTGHGESSGKTDAFNPAGPYRGLMQIGDREAISLGYMPEEMFDPVKNLAAAHALHQQRGKQPWPSSVKYKGAPTVTSQAFVPDYPGAIVVPAHPSNYYRPEDHGGVPNKPRGWVLHTPEEPADDVESTPAYFQGANRQASTIYYLDNDGDVYQLLPERCAAIANGVVGKPYPAWADRNTSLNWQTLNVEIEGYAATIHQTMTPAQFNSLVRLIKHRSAAYGFPCDRAHVIGHYEVSNERSDPGPKFPWDALMAALQEEEIMRRFNATAPTVSSQNLTAGQPLRVSLSDFSPPLPAGRMYRVELYASPGNVQEPEMRILDGDGAYAGQLGWGRGGQDGYGCVDVLTQNGGFHIMGVGRVELVGVVGYWP